MSQTITFELDLTNLNLIVSWNIVQYFKLQIPFRYINNMNIIYQ